MPRLPRIRFATEPSTPVGKIPIRRFPFPFSTLPLVRISSSSSDIKVSDSNLKVTADTDTGSNPVYTEDRGADQAFHLKPFPVPLRIGTDVCYIPRIRAILDGRIEIAERFVRKVLNEKERAAQISRTFNGPILGNFLAGRWAAKEATIKAHPNYRLTMQDITIAAKQNADGTSGAPVAYVRMLDKKSMTEELREVRVSISHDGEYATAVCLAAGYEAYAPNEQGVTEEDSESKRKTPGFTLTRTSYSSATREGLAPVSNLHLPSTVTVQNPGWFKTKNMRKAEQRRERAAQEITVRPSTNIFHPDAEKVTDLGQILITPSSSEHGQSTDPRYNKKILVVTSVPSSVTQSELLAAFSGLISPPFKAYMPKTRHLTKSVFVLFHHQIDAVCALKRFENGIEVGGVIAHVIRGTVRARKPTDAKSVSDSGGSKFNIRKVHIKAKETSKVPIRLVANDVQSLVRLYPTETSKPHLSTEQRELDSRENAMEVQRKSKLKAENKEEFLTNAEELLTMESNEQHD